MFTHSHRNPNTNCPSTVSKDANLLERSTIPPVSERVERDASASKQFRFKTRRKVEQLADDKTFPFKPFEKAFAAVFFFFYLHSSGNSSQEGRVHVIRIPSRIAVIVSFALPGAVSQPQGQSPAAPISNLRFQRTPGSKLNWID
ncbi:hypothetical protein AVEN_218779-1 [Araneus ventricosus]|uniref:Uncharacterized protein n=1 Tax=Araneus ventricosus TaxID=182803 RepID=A0A4Y2B5M0_ARAVE|nr:hypothetical protein AVEN_218779-1 [Araneus ventricosus]